MIVSNKLFIYLLKASWNNLIEINGAVGVFHY